MRIIAKSLPCFSILIAARHHHHRHSLSKKLTHSQFPKGGYLLVHYPLADRIIFSRNNRINEKGHSSEHLSNDISNDTVENYETTTTTRRNSYSVKKRYIMKFKRDADPNYLEHCCSESAPEECTKLYCH